MAKYHVAATDAQGRLTAPSVLSQIDARTKATMRADLPALAKELNIGGGSGIEQVSGTITLDSTGAPIREVYATAAATVQGEVLAAGDAAVFRRLGGAWDVLVVGKDAAWRRVGTVAPPTPVPGTTPPAPPTGTTPPAAPTGVTASNVTSTTATLTWTASAGATGYRVSLDGEKTWTPVTGTTINLTGLLPSTLYAPKVQAFNGAYSASASGSPFTTAASKVYADTFDAPDGTALSGRVMPTGAATWVSPDNMLNTGNSALTITGGKATATEVGGGASFLIPSPDTIVQVDYDVTAAAADTQVRAGVDGAPYMTFNATSGARLGTWSTPIVGMGLPRTGTLTHVYSGNSVTTYVNGQQYGKPLPVPAARPKLAVATFRGGKVDAIRVDPAMNPGVARAMTITESFDGAAGTSLIGTTTDTGGYQWISAYDTGVTLTAPVLTGDGSVTNTGNGGGAAIVTDAASDETVRVTATYDVSGDTARQVRLKLSPATGTGVLAILYGTGELKGVGTEPETSIGTGLPLTGTLALEMVGGVCKVFVNGTQRGGTFTASASAVAASFGVWKGSKISNLEVTIK